MKDSSIDLPAPEDDGAADHLPGRRLPAIVLPASDGRRVRLDELPARSLVFVYPGIDGPGRDDLLEEWTAIPGARGCTSEACSFRDELAGFQAAGVEVLGLSSQSSSSQRDHVRRLGLPYPLLSDEPLRLSEELGLPTFDFHGRRCFKRLTLIVGEAIIEAALYPVFPPDQGAAQALRWLDQHGWTLVRKL
ncbi:MAG: redoxin family protein [Nitriliruptorales bacterium]|nr:redoxin family protein [Nitriliruptorales bacterium]